MGPKKDFRSSEEVSILSKGVKIEGKFSSDGNVRIDGIIVGDVLVNGNLTLGDGSKIQGEINAKNVTISGSIEGSVKATEKVILESSSRLKGDVISKLLIIQEGAKFDGKSTMTPIPPSAPKPDIK